MACKCKVGPGKFEGEPAHVFMAWEQAMLGNADVTVGRYDFLRAPFNLDADRCVVEAAREYGYCEECTESTGDVLREAAGLVVWPDDVGFVYCRTFKTREAFDKAIEEAEAESEEEEG